METQQEEPRAGLGTSPSLVQHQQPAAPIDEPILKERKKPNFTPEYRAQLSERMKKVNADRIAKSRAANKDKLVQEVEAKALKKLQMETELAELRKKVAMQEEVKKKVKKEAPPKRAQQVQVISMPDPEDNTDDDMSDVDLEQPKQIVILKAKKSKAAAKKEEPAPQPAPTPKPAPPVQRFKFL